jgi:hypothetical protein
MHSPLLVRRPRKRYRKTQCDFTGTESRLPPQPQVRSIFRTFSSGREAKEYLIAQIVLEAERDGMPLSETERKMLYFTETAWTLPDIWEVNEVLSEITIKRRMRAKSESLR